MRHTADPWLQEEYSQDHHESLSWATQMDLWFLICSAWSPHINPLLYSLGFSGSLWTNGVLINPSQHPYMIIHNFSLPKNVMLILNYASVFLCCRAIGEPMYVITQFHWYNSPSCFHQNLIFVQYLVSLGRTIFFFQALTLGILFVSSIPEEVCYPLSRVAVNVWTHRLIQRECER